MALLHAALNQGTYMHANTWRHVPTPHTRQRAPAVLIVKGRKHPCPPALPAPLRCMSLRSLKWGCMRGEGNPDPVPKVKEGEVRGEGAHSCHTELLCRMMAPCEACHCSDWWGGWGSGWVQVCMRVRMHQGEGIRLLLESINAAFILTRQRCARMQIYKH